jgi:hypothetical protein
MMIILVLLREWSVRKMGTLQREADRLVVFLGWFNVKRRWLWYSLAHCHDLSKLELPGAWEPPDSSSPREDSEGKEARFGFLNGNQDYAK